MTSRFSELVVDAHDLRTLADFWCAVLDYKIIEERDDVIEIGPEEPPAGWDPEFMEEWKARLRAAPSAPTIVFVPVPEDKAGKNRIHIDVSPIDSQEGEVKRLLTTRGEQSRHRSRRRPLDRDARPRRQRVLRPAEPRAVISGGGGI